MTKKERIQAAIPRREAGQDALLLLDPTWPGTDLDPEAISRSTYEFYKNYRLRLRQDHEQRHVRHRGLRLHRGLLRDRQGRRGQGGEHPHLLRRRLAEADGLPLHPGQQRPGACAICSWSWRS